MEFLSAEKLARLVYEERKGAKYRWFSFKEISSPPSLRVNLELTKLYNCTCALHSVEDIQIKRKCRFISAFEKAKEARLISN